jgi:putative two-component system response regulator
MYYALTMSRPYKKAWPIEKAVKLICDESGRQFDPSVVGVFQLALDQILVVREKFAD